MNAVCAQVPAILGERFKLGSSEFLQAACGGQEAGFACIYQSRDFPSDPQVFALTPEIGQAYALKLDMQTGAGRIDREFQTLRDVQPHFSSDPRNAVADPVYVSPGGLFHVTGMIPGHTAKEILYRTGNDAQAAQIYRRAGSWLDRLHQLRPAEPSRFWGNWMLEEIEDICTASDPAAPADARRSYAAALQQQIAALDGAEDAMVFSHGDFHCENLIMGRGTAYGLDFSDARMKLAAYDIADFLKSDAIRPAGPEDLASNGIRKQTLDMFFRTYSIPLRRDVLDVCLRGRLLIEWLSISAETYARSSFQHQRFSNLTDRLAVVFGGSVTTA